MALVVPVRGKTPAFGSDCFLAENATIIGDVKMGEQCSVWFQAVVRGDVNSIEIGNRVNIQDGAVIHATFEKAATNIADDVSIGHRAIVHGCTLQERVLVGMGAIIMDNAIAQADCLIAAGAVVLENQVLESGYVYAGVPAKKIKKISKEMREGLIERISQNYITYASWFKE